MRYKKNAPAMDQMTGATSKPSSERSSISEFYPNTPEKQLVQVVRVFGRVVAGLWVIPDLGLTLCKDIHGSKHMLKRPPAIAIDRLTLEQAESAGAIWAEIRDVETGKIYRALLSTIRARGFQFNRGFGDQVALALAAWNRDEEPQPAQLELDLS